MPNHTSIAGKALHKGKQGTGGKHGAANQGEAKGTSGTSGPSSTAAGGEVGQKNAQGGGPGGGS